MPSEVSTGNIFISYRRQDSAAYAGRISDHLTAFFGEHRLFMDVEDIQPGQNFAQTIDQTIAKCTTVLVIIGPRWMEILRDRSRQHQKDYVDHEIESAIARRITIIPVIVGGANMAQLTDLPPSLADLTFHQAVEIRDDTFREDCARLANALGAPAGQRGEHRGGKTAHNTQALWMGGLAALIAVLVALWIGPAPWKQQRERKARVQQLMDVARTQINQEEYEPALRTYQDAVKVDPNDRAATDGAVDAAMLWVENFHVITREGQKAEELAGPGLSELMSVLDAGLARTNGRGSRAADIQAHLGWAHWLNQHIAYKEFGPAAEQALRKALDLDPSNLYANAMLGNWLLQTHGSLDEAVRHFDVALKNGQHKPWVRNMQLGGMIHNEDPGVRRELIRVANQMRINSESMDERYKSRVLSNYSPINSQEELTETLSAVPPDEAWATFLWLDDKHATDRDLEAQRIQHEFIQASILEIAGKTAEAVTKMTTLQHELKLRGYSGSIADHVTGAIKRMSRSPAR